MSKKSIAIIIFAALILTGCNTTNEIAVTSSSITSTTESEAISTSTTSTTASTTETNTPTVGRSSMSGGMFGGRNNTTTNSIVTTTVSADELNALLKNVKSTIGLFTIEDAKASDCIDAINKVMNVANNENAQTIADYFNELLETLKQVHVPADRIDDMVDIVALINTCIEDLSVPGDVEFEVDENNQIQGVTSTTTVTITPDIEVEDTDIEVGVFDEDDIKTDVNAGVSNEYGKVGNYTNTSYNEEWAQLGTQIKAFGLTHFSSNQTDDLMKFVKSGYLTTASGGLVKDPRIASRAGGIDNPRRPWWTEFDDADDLSSCAEMDACWLVVTKDANITQDVVDIFEDKNSTQDELNSALESIYGSDMCPGMEVSYSARNYCGDIIRIVVGGNEVNWSGKSWNATGEFGLDEHSLPGIDYKVECKEDPSAIRLLTAEESRNYLISTGYGGGAAAKFWNDTRELVTTKSLDVAEYAVESMYTKDGELVSSGYIATKPGIFTCTVTNMANGDTVDIVIENLPVHYKELKWGCSTQREMDLVTGYYLNNPDHGMIAGTFNGLASLSDRDSVGMPVWAWNEVGYKDINGKVVTLKETDEAEWFTQHIESGVAEVCIQGGKGVYNGFNTYGFLQTGMGECEANAAQSQTHYELAGITSRYVGNSTHGWLEIKVPSSIAKDGQEHWIAVDYHSISSNHIAPTWRSNEVEGWCYWK